MANSSSYYYGKIQECKIKKTKYSNLYDAVNAIVDKMNESSKCFNNAFLCLRNGYECDGKTIGEVQINENLSGISNNISQLTQIKSDLHYKILEIDKMLADYQVKFESAKEYERQQEIARQQKAAYAASVKSKYGNTMSANKKIYSQTKVGNLLEDRNKPLI